MHKSIRPGRGRMEIGLAQPGCVYMSVVVHELFSYSRRSYEQSRLTEMTTLPFMVINMQEKGPSQFYKDAGLELTPSCLAIFVLRH